MNTKLAEILTRRVEELYQRLLSEFPAQKIAQIKELRTVTGFGLKDSKDIMETGSFHERSALILRIVLDNCRDLSAADGPIAVRHVVVGERWHDSPVLYFAPSLDEANRVKEFFDRQFDLRGLAVVGALI